MRSLFLAAALMLFVSSRAGAQPYVGTASPRVGSFEISGGVLSSGGYDAGSRSALESPNSTSTSAPPLTLFTTTSRVARATGAEVRLGIFVSPRISVEGTFQFTRPVLQTAVADDFENAAAVTAEDTLSSYVAGGSLLYHFGSGRFVPFVSGGGAYLRQLHEDKAELLTGSEIHAGGGVKYWLGARRVGLRLDAQASSRSKSIAFEQKRRVVRVLSAGLVYLF
ncbi:MAG TPA: hypothetical protein VEL51_13605 [Vicinamibacterales bacterium]|nr:hypothetical protein [Vicinamibacterales bacterium]